LEREEEVEAMGLEENLDARGWCGVVRRGGGGDRSA
jgi:hypothetical protein